MHPRALLATAALLTLAACSGEAITGLDHALYNATYTGPATIHNGTVLANIPSGESSPLTFTMTLSQLGQSFTGTFFLADTTGQHVYSGAVTGKTNNTGADFTFVVPAPCAGVLYGSFTVSNSELTGAATGRDCSDAATGTNTRITFTNLVRQ